MPIQHLYKKDTQALGLWKITEDESTLFKLLENQEVIPTSILHQQKRLEFLASRLVTQELLKEFNQAYFGIHKNEFGKPYLTKSSIHISQSHSYPYVAVILDLTKNVGVDIEQTKSKLLRIAPRVFSDFEIEHTKGNITKLCVLWCAKETLIKLYGQKNLVLKDEIEISAFQLSKTGLIQGRITKKEYESMYTLQYLVEEEFVLVFNP
jgi:4'-phosphopantetheinyl transferase